MMSSPCRWLWLKSTLVIFLHFLRVSKSFAVDNPFLETLRFDNLGRASIPSRLVSLFSLISEESLKCEIPLDCEILKLKIYLT